MKTLDKRPRNARGLLTDMAGYYAQRAASLEQVYKIPERQADLSAMTERVREALRGQRVLELACGTGYWTEVLAATAESVVATDINSECLELAIAKGLPAARVRFALADALDPAIESDGKISACFAGFWWSHVLRQDQEGFLRRLREKLGTDCLLVLLDNVFIESDSTTIARTDLEGNTYQIRTTANGDRYEVLKNYPTDSALRKKFAGSVKEIRIVRLEHYWMLTGRLK